MVSINTIGGGQIMYSVDGANFQEANIFENLPAGNFAIFIMDELECTTTDEITITASEAFSIQSIETIPSSCGINIGSIEIITDNDFAFYSLNGAVFSEINIYESLSSGMYNVLVQNESGCEVELEIAVEEGSPECELIVPNAFTPDGDGINDFFNIVKYAGFQGRISMEVFNRWGEKVYTRNDIILDEDGWIGTKEGKALPADVYVYIIQVSDNLRDETEIFSGDITLIR